MEYLGRIMRKGIALCAFDFCGCGNAEGEYITMGYFEQQDLKQIVDYITSDCRLRGLALWGRSMGAVTAILYLGKTINIKAVILDSPYKDGRVCIEQVLQNSSSLPSIMMGGASKLIVKTIEEKTGFDLNNVNPLKYNVPG